MDVVLQFFSSPIIKALATASSFVSLGLSLIVLINVRRIRNFYVFTARVPQLVEKLKDNSSALSNHLNEFESSRQQIALGLADTEIVLQSLKKKVRGHQRKLIASLVKLIRTYDHYEDGPDDLWGIYIEIHKVITMVENLREDLKWERVS